MMGILILGMYVLGFLLLLATGFHYDWFWALTSFAEVCWGLVMVGFAKWL